ncbi:ferrous iron transport protein B [Asticcacaulis biprosthecium C19]|uniref:Fe(2+) transporter FeoB n=1 Tax=Asticcacaulis biprosthecium C19 TaxID=715226 RepID=F4QN61_9CAUL|nr:ferrous iron transporter B [Asticcacaulis biprosthecium]EGF91652.1 ferrous iron transport protein B [Asticcacaulis biprosthecium C19]
MSTLNIALVGNPNCGKTALFNQLTGSRQKVANYAGVTVERKEGTFTAPSGRTVHVLDLPGTYSLDALGADEIITRDACLGQIEGVAVPDVIVCVADATNLRLHLRFVLEIRRLGRPMVLALNMMDAARKRGIEIDTAALERELGLPVIETVAVTSEGTKALITQIDRATPSAPPINAVDIDHNETRRILSATVVMPTRTAKTDDALDRFLLNPWLGIPLLLFIMFLVFQAVFTWAAPAMDAIEASLAWLGGIATQPLADGLLKSFIADALFGGLGSVLVFLPQIIILFFFILILEESGYLPRASFLLDRVMGAAGLTGRSFIPLLSSHACAIPGIMATRSIPDLRERMTTILISPLMTCSARIPVYTLLIGAFLPNTQVFGVLSFQGLVLFGMYLIGILSGLIVSWVISISRREKREYPLLMELPSYRFPNLKSLALGLWERAMIFIRRITGIIFAVNTLLWVLVTFPGKPDGATGPDIDYSIAGRIGHFIQPAFDAIGFNWQICVALIPGLAAREVAVSALGTVYSVAGSDDEIASQLGGLISSQWSLATALSLMAWYVFAPQCLSTLAVIKRETNGWTYVAITAGYLFTLAYVAAFATYQITLGLTS